jgi:glycerol 3-phosphatase-2
MGRATGAPTRAARSIVQRYDALFVDLDGVVYRGHEPLPHAAEAVQRARGLGLRVLYLTNNSSRTPEQVAAHLARMGVEAAADEVLTSGLATAAMLRREGWEGRSAFVIGERGVREALTEAGIRLVDADPGNADLVVIGWDREVDYAKLRVASLLVQRGARLVATNADASYPAPDGLWPGSGAILAAVTTTTGAVPTVVGKPHRPLFEAATEATGATVPLVIGDRLDTDVAGARVMGWDSLLVLSGASRARDVVRARHAPTYVGHDLRTLFEDLPRGEFSRARDEDAPGIRRLLESSGLSSKGVEGRVGLTRVCADGQVEAAACMDQVEGYGLLRAVAVREANRGKGLGVLAVAAALQDARDRGISHVFLFTESAAPFFERLGFGAVDRADLPGPVGTSEHASEECATSAVAMTLDLVRPPGP